MADNSSSAMFLHSSSLAAGRLIVCRVQCFPHRAKLNFSCSMHRVLPVHIMLAFVVVELL